MLFSEPDRSEAEVDGEAALRWIPGHGEETRSLRELRGSDPGGRRAARGDGGVRRQRPAFGSSENSKKRPGKERLVAGEGKGVWCRT